jgi:hypothetical protein
MLIPDPTRDRPYKWWSVAVMHPVTPEQVNDVLAPFQADEVAFTSCGDMMFWAYHTTMANQLVRGYASGTWRFVEQVEAPK